MRAALEFNRQTKLGTFFYQVQIQGQTVLGAGNKTGLGTAADVAFTGNATQSNMFHCSCRKSKRCARASRLWKQRSDEHRDQGYRRNRDGGFERAATCACSD